MFSFGKSSKNFLALVDCADASYSVASKFPVLVGGQNDCSLKIEGADFKFEVSAEKSGGLTAKLLERGTLLVNGIEPSDVFEVGAVCTLQFGERLFYLISDKEAFERAKRMDVSKWLVFYGKTAELRTKSRSEE